MSATDLAAVVIAIAALFVVGALVWIIIELRRTAEQLRASLERFDTHVATSIENLNTQSQDVDDELRRIGGLIDSAERVTARADTLSRVTYGAVARPVIKTAAVVKGTSKAARRLKRGADNQTPSTHGGEGTAIDTAS